MRRSARAESSIRRHLERHALLAAGSTVICAVSGGADSMALLHWLHTNRHRLGLRVEAAHLHHGIPQARSDEAAAAVRTFCQERGIPLHARFVDVPAMARSEGIGIEAAGHLARRRWLRRLARAEGARVATAHTADDQAETVLMRLLRGAGTRGLRGILPCLGTPPWLVRPFLTLTRSQTREMARAWNLPVVEDPTNDDPSYGTRNRVRHELIPQLTRGFNPRVVSSLCRLAEAARADDTLLETLSRRAARRSVEGSSPVVIAAAAATLPASLRVRVLRHAIRRAKGRTDRFDAAAISRLDDLLWGRVGRRTRIAGLWAVRTAHGVSLDRGETRPPRTVDAEISLPVPGEVRVAGWTVRAWLVEDEGETSPRREPGPSGFLSTMHPPWRAALRGVTEVLRVRRRRPGDRWRPARGTGSRKVKATLNAWGVPTAQRDAIPLVTAGSAIACVPGWGVDERFRRAEAGAPVIQLEFSFEEEESD